MVSGLMWLKILTYLTQSQPWSPVLLGMALAMALLVPASFFYRQGLPEPSAGTELPNLPPETAIEGAISARCCSASPAFAAAGRWPCRRCIWWRSVAI